MTGATGHPSGNRVRKRRPERDRTRGLDEEPTGGPGNTVGDFRLRQLMKARTAQIVGAAA